MTRDEYVELIAGAHALRIQAEDLGLRRIDEALNAINLAESVGPVLDATLFQARGGAMAEDRETLRAVRALAGVREGTPAS